MVTLDKNVKTGDVYRLHYDITGFGKDGAIESLVNKLDTDPRWKVISYGRPHESEVWFDIQIVQNAFPLLVIVGAVAAIGTGLFVFLSFTKAEQIIDATAGNPTLSVTFLMFAAAALLIAWKWG